MRVCQRKRKAGGATGGAGESVPEEEEEVGGATGGAGESMPQEEEAGGATAEGPPRPESDDSIERYFTKGTSANEELNVSALCYLKLSFITTISIGKSFQ